MKWEKIKSSPWVEILFLGIISALVYLPNVTQFTYYKDDWYYMYDGFVHGSSAFIEMFRHLRPIRGPLYATLFNIFGINPLPYHLLLYFWRLLGGVCALWMFKILWPKQSHATFFMSLFFLIYPGFLWWVAGIEYQPMVLSLTLQVFSITLTLKSIQVANQPRKQWFWLATSILTGWAYLAYVEYAIGMEAFRWLAIYLLVTQNNPDLPFWAKIRKSMEHAAITLIIPLGFLFWHQFIFDNQRKAADIGLQAGQLLSSPLTSLWWMVHAIRSSLNIMLLAWSVPFDSLFYSGRLREILSNFGVAGIVLGLVWGINHFFLKDDASDKSTKPWFQSAILIGMLGTAAGVIPIIIANRQVEFERFSHYALPGSLAGVVFLGGLIYAIKSHFARQVAVALLVGLATLTHAANASNAIAQEQTISAFWWQVAWRAPGIIPGTTLVVRYPGINFGEGSDVVWGPANFIYYPEAQSALPIHVWLPGARMEGETIKQILSGAKMEQNYIVINTITLDFDQMLILTQPSEGACMHAIDGRWPGLSLQDDSTIVASASYSEIEQIVMNGDMPRLPPELFGTEPAHNWCYYYQKADLARQQGDWEQVIKFGHEAEKLGLTPNDAIEWIPFAQAYAVLGEEKALKQLATRINTEAFYKHQACEIFNAMHADLSPRMIAMTIDVFCGKNVSN